MSLAQRALLLGCFGLILILGMAFAAEGFCYLFPIRRINRPGLNRVFETPEFSVRVRTNSLGMRHRREIPIKKPSGERRIFLIGDSMVFGSTLQRRDSVPARLQRLLNPDGKKTYRVINTSASATGPMHYEQRLRTLAIPYQSDLAVVFYYVGNDMQDTWDPYLVFPYSLKNRFKQFFPNAYLWWAKWRNNTPVSGQWNEPQKVSYDDWSQDKMLAWGKILGLKKEEVNARASAVSPIARDWLGKKLVNPSRIYSAMLHPTELNDISALESTGMRKAMERCKQILTSINRRAKKAGIPVVLVIIPSSEQVNDEQWEFLRALGYEIDAQKVLRDKPQQELLTVCAEEKIPCLDLLPVLRAAKILPLYQAHNSMWKPETAAYVAESVKDFLKEKKLL